MIFANYEIRYDELTSSWDKFLFSKRVVAMQCLFNLCAPKMYDILVEKIKNKS